MRRVNPVVTTAIRSQLFDRDDCGSRTLRNKLFLSFQRRQLHLAVESHRRTFYNQDKTNHQRQRQQDTCTTLHQQIPEVTDRMSRFRCHRLENSRQGCHTRCRRNKLEKHDDKQLCKISQPALAAVMLQVTVHHETDTGIKRQVRRLARIAVGVQRQVLLEIQQEHSPEKPKQVNGQQCFEEALPTHFHVRVDAAQFKNPSFHRGHEVQAGLLPFINFCNVLPQRVGQHDHEYYLRDAT